MLMGRSIDIGEAVIGDAHILLLGEKEEDVELKVRFGLDMGEAIILEEERGLRLRYLYMYMYTGICKRDVPAGPRSPRSGYNKQRRVRSRNVLVVGGGGEGRSRTRERCTLGRA
jgi:hypothetical protein